MRLPKLSPHDIQAAIPALKPIGNPIKGGQKLVFPCEIDGQLFALKVMAVSPAPRNDPGRLDEAAERAAREVELMGQFDSPYLVKLGPIGLVRNRICKQEVAYFTEEWIDGPDLQTLIKQNGPMAPNDVIRLGLDIVSAIDLLWGKDTVHRDIKPSNIMCRDSSGVYVLLDMGLAFDLADVSLTRTGQVAGTPAYMSPEQLDLTRKRDLDCRSDFFALGIVLYETLTGKHPFQPPRASGASVTHMIQHANVVPPSRIRSGIPPRLEATICRLLEKKPQLRYRNCADCQAALKRALS